MTKQEQNNFKIFVFRAIDEPELCEQYLKGHQKVLEDYGITNVTSNNNTWTQNPNIYCIGLQNNNKLMGGIRIQIADGIFPLPVEDAVGYMDNKVHSIVLNFALNGGVGELSGLWVSNSLKGLGFGMYLIRAAIASSSQLKFKTMIGICAKYSLKMFINVGFKVDYSLGIGGDFEYPNNNYIAHVVGILNAITLENANKSDKQIMQSLRFNPNQTRREIELKENTIIEYKLLYPKVLPVKYNFNPQTKVN